MIKIYAIAIARLIILIILFAGLAVIFPLYVLCLIAGEYISLVIAYTDSTKQLLASYDKQLNTTK